MDNYTILCAELRGSAQSLNGNIAELQKKAEKLQKAINKVTRGDHKVSDLSTAYTAQSALAGSMTRLGEICGAMNTAALQFSEASAELSGRANLTAYYMQHTDTLSYEELIGNYSAAIASSGSAVAGYALVKEALRDTGYPVSNLAPVSNVVQDAIQRETVVLTEGTVPSWLTHMVGPGAMLIAESFLDESRLHSYFSKNETIDNINEFWDEIPSEFSDAFKEITGDEGKSVYSAIDLTLDVISGECDWDTLETFLKTVEVEGTKASVVVKTLKMVCAPEGTMKSLMDGNTTYQDEAVDAFLDGKIGEGLWLTAKSIGSGLGAIGYGVGEVFTELASETVDDVLDLATLPVRFVRHFIPGKVGEAVYDLGDKLDAGVDKITGWISNLL